MSCASLRMLLLFHLCFKNNTLLISSLNSLKIFKHYIQFLKNAGNTMKITGKHKLTETITHYLQIKLMSTLKCCQAGP